MAESRGSERDQVEGAPACNSATTFVVEPLHPQSGCTYKFKLARGSSIPCICVVTAWLGHHVIVDLGFAEQRLTATVPVEGLVVFKRQGPDQTLIDLMARPESGAAADR